VADPATPVKLKAPEASVVSVTAVPPPPVLVSVTIAALIAAPVESFSFTTPLTVAAFAVNKHAAKIDRIIKVFRTISKNSFVKINWNGYDRFKKLLFSAPFHETAWLMTRENF
jgi:hypothetical protein